MYVMSNQKKNKNEVIKSKISKYYHHSRHNLQWDNILLLLLWYNAEYVKPKIAGDIWLMVTIKLQSI